MLVWLWQNLILFLRRSARWRREPRAQGRLGISKHIWFCHRREAITQIVGAFKLVAWFSFWKENFLATWQAQQSANSNRDGGQDAPTTINGGSPANHRPEIALETMHCALHHNHSAFSGWPMFSSKKSSFGHGMARSIFKVRPVQPST